MFLLAAPDPGTIGLVLALVAIFVFVVLFLATRFKRCPSNRVLVIYGKVGDQKSSRCIHGGGAFVWPLIQDYAYLDLAPRTIDIDLIGALSKKNIRVNVPSTFTVGISTNESIMGNAAERLLGLTDTHIRDQAKDIILGQMRLVLATLSIEEINQDREKFLALVNDNVGTELSKIGLEVINVNIRDITDESGYIEAIGKKAAAEAVNQARIEVAQEERKGAIGEAEAYRFKEVRVAEEKAQSVQGQKAAERTQRVELAKLEAEAIQGQKAAERDQLVAVATLAALTEQGRKEAERNQRVAVAEFEATAVDGENRSKAIIADTNAALAEREADARRRSEVAAANARKEILEAQRLEEMARLAKEEVVRQDIDRQKLEIEAEARAEQIRRVARGEADAILATREAEATGLQKILDAKARGYENLLRACNGDTTLAPTLLMIEKVSEIVGEQVKAISNLKIDKITVWDGGGKGPGGNTTSNFLSGLMGSLPAMHELANQAGIRLPEILGRIESSSDDPGRARAPEASTDVAAAPRPTKRRKGEDGES